MKSIIKRYLVGGLTLSIVALTSLRNWAEQELGGDEVQGQTNGNSLGQVPRRIREESLDSQGHTSPAMKVTLSGKVVRDGARFALRETAGRLFVLDSVARAWEYEGEDVRITGKLDFMTHRLHIDDIESLVA